jgi:hypothetical protein
MFDYQYTVQCKGCLKEFSFSEEERPQNPNEVMYHCSQLCLLRDQGLFLFLFLKFLTLITYLLLPMLGIFYIAFMYQMSICIALIPPAILFFLLMLEFGKSDK